MATKWIQKAIKKKGALRKTAKRAGLIKKNQPLTAADLNRLSKSKNPTTRRRANLARTMAGFRRKR